MNAEGKRANVVLIDDDIMNNIICKRFIQFVNPHISIQIFSDAQSGLEYLLDARSIPPAETKTIVLLDINMPALSGWKILQMLSEHDEVNSIYAIYMLTSSISAKDRNIAVDYPFLRGYIIKPLTQEIVRDIFSENNIDHRPL